ncbi:MAG: hypothetical protein JWS10_2969 [Cypionkella sp.]|uniref:hypothetical protein n=1 Tax=Cypionkella sp. TaxID=2811411 RepID=UPI0026135BBE|nr:hypothetical protein [Cypionkella sp.]MDB5660354.1 hypothetical protein [Cypionkella sp.]
MSELKPKAAPRKHAGGKATEAGMNFQAEVGTWLATHLLARLPVGGRFGIASVALPVNIQFETGEGLDDALLVQNDGSRIDFQAKTKASLSTNSTDPLGKTIAQLVRTVADAKVSGIVIDTTKRRAVLAVTAAAPQTLNNLERGCRAFDMGGAWLSTKAQRSQAEREALELFESHARTAWAAHTTILIDEHDLVTMARLFRIVRFSMDEGDDNWREAARVLGRRLYGGDAAGEAPLLSLKAIIRGLIGSGAAADREGLLRTLRKLGHNDVGSAGYEPDLVRLAAITDAELSRLAEHTRLPIGGGVPVARDSDAPLIAAVATGSLIVVGEPGAGKTGSMVALTEARRACGDTVVFLSVDRFPGVSIASDLQSELGLAHPLAEVLTAAPGTGGKLLVIDALDAARGGPAEGVFAQLIEKLSTEPDTGWTIMVSIRTFDLKNGRRFRNAMPGNPPNANFAEPSLSGVRHFLIPRLTQSDLDRAASSVGELGVLLAAAPDKLRDLLRNIFNLSLAAQLLADGASPASIRFVATQSDLIDAYEDRRLTGTAIQQAAGAAVGAMVQRRRMAVRKIVVGHDRLDDVIQSGVLAETGDLVSFSHHVLFDHVAGCFYLEWDDPEQLIGQLGGDSSIALMLAPGLRFSLERLWRRDAADKVEVWRLVANIYTDVTVDPVLANVALRTAIDCVETAANVVGLTAIIAARANDEALATMLSRLARFVGIAVGSSGTISASEALAWAGVADACIVTGNCELSDPTRLLLHTLFDKADMSDPDMLSLFGRASRALLTLAWAEDPVMQNTAVNGILFVGKSFGSDPSASGTLLDRVLREPHFSAHADREATWLAKQIMPIARANAEFAVEIYRVLYSRQITDDATSYFGGQPSRILSLSSRRSQDYLNCRYNLGRRTGQLLELSANLGTRVVNEATLGNIVRDGPLGYGRKRVILPGRAPFDLLGHEHGFNSWSEPDADRPSQKDDVLTHYVTFLRAANPAIYAESIDTAATNYVHPALWARLLGVGAERVAEVGDLLWPFASDVTMFAHHGIVRDAVRFLAAAYPTRSKQERAAFETEALRPDLFTSEQELRWWQSSLARLLSLVDEAHLAIDAMHLLRAELASQSALAGNPPLRSVKTLRGSPGGITRSLMAGRGVDVEEGIDARMLAQSDTLYELVQTTSSTSDADALAALWSETMVTVALYDAHVGELHEEVEQPVWGYISNAVERISGNDSFVPDAGELPDMVSFFALLERLWTSRYPEAKDASEDAGLSWSNWDVRVCAADAYVSLADRFGEAHGEIVDKFDEILADPVAQVRLQAARSLQVLSRIAPERMWVLAERLAHEERHAEVLASFLHALSRFTRDYAERCEAIIEIVRARHEAVERDGNSGRDQIASSLGGLIAQLWVWQGRHKALDWLVDWAGQPAEHREFLTSFLSQLRGAFFARYASGKDHDPPVADRAQQAAMLILEGCSAVAARSHRALTVESVEGAERDAVVTAYKAAEIVIGHLMNQLYFGSGAYADNKEAQVGLVSPDFRRRFLVDYRPMLELLAISHEPSTHHHLVELYEYLIMGDPAGVFDALHAVLLGAGAREGYHHESMASSVIVPMITLYLADHRSIFEDSCRRDRLIAILRLFSDVGWPEALKLLYDLPELLR